MKNICDLACANATKHIQLNKNQHINEFIF